MSEKLQLMLKVSILLFLSFVSIFYGLILIFGFHLEIGTLGPLKNLADPETQAVFTLWNSRVNLAVFFSVAFWGLFFYEKKSKWVVFLCGASLFWWLFRFHHFCANASSILNARQIRSSFVRFFIELLVPLVVLGMQLILFSKGKIPKHFDEGANRS